MDDEESFQNYKEKEIKRLSDTFGEKEPINGILTDDEILKFAGNSKEASRIRLKRGIGTFKDKRKVYDEIGIIWMFFPFTIGFWLLLSVVLNWVIGQIIFGGITLLLIIFTIYYFYIKDFTNFEYKKYNQIKEDKNIKKVEETEPSSDDDLLLLFRSKEKIAREIIEKRFPSPQLTNTKFNAVLDDCKEVVESQIETLNALTLTEKTAYEISSRKKLIKQVIMKVDDLTNELILSDENDLEEVIDEMDNLIISVKNYE